MLILKVKIIAKNMAIKKPILLHFPKKYADRDNVLND